MGYADVVLEDAPTHYWRGNTLVAGTPASAADVPDVSYNTVTLGATSPLKGDSSAGAFSLTNGGGGWLGVGNMDTPFNGVNFTVECWFNCTSFATQQWLFNCHVAQLTGDSAQFFVNTAGQLTCACWGGSFIGGGTVTPGVWHHAVWVRDRTNALSHVYLDGAQVAQGNEGNYDAGGSTAGFGREFWSGGSTMTGSLAECAIYGSKVLTAAQVARHYNEGLRSGVTY